MEASAPRLLFFHTARSGPSRRAEGFLAQVLQRRRNHDTFRVYRIDVDERADLAEKFRVEITPTLIVVDGKRVKGRLERPHGCLEIEALLKPWLQ